MDQDLLRTRTFIGSSSEGIAIANAIKTNLMNTTECQIWTEGVFLPGRTFIETLETLLDTVDYAILVATPDDVLKKRDIENFSMRDNVLLELGLFMAKLGRTRTYLVSPADNPIHIPSDLLGIATATYESPATLADAVAALTAPCDAIQSAMHEAAKGLSLAMKRLLVKRLLTLTNRVQGFVVAFQSESIKSLLDREQFDRVRTESIQRFARLVEGFQDDATRLGLQLESQSLIATVAEAIEHLPFPSEITITEDDIAGGLLSHFTGKQSAKNQVQEQIGKLINRFDEWWTCFGARIAGALNTLQAALISAM